MSIAEFRASDYGNLGYQFLEHVQQYYPDVSAVYCIRRSGDLRTNFKDPGTIRVRSRGRHNPGSGDYFCSHVDPPGKINGYLVGNVFYATNLPTCTYMNGSCEYTASYSYSAWTREDWMPSWRWSNYYYRHAVFDHCDNGSVTWRVTTFHGAVQDGDKEHAKAEAFIHDPDVGYEVWYRLARFDDDQHIPQPTFEDRYVREAIRSRVYPGIDTFMNDAYLQAFKSLPVVKTNNIQNLFAVYDILKGFVTPFLNGDRLVQGVGSLGDAWLGTRYGLFTTKADIQEIVSVVDRCRNLRNGQTFRSYGISTYQTLEDTFYFKCSLTTQLTDVLGCYSELERLGLALDGYNAWDLIPYSFMVDWFLHIGDLLERGRDWSHALKLAPLSDTWFSMTHYFTNAHGCAQCDYYRWPGSAFSVTLPSSMLSHQQAKGSTWVKRGVDALSIFS